MSESFNVWVAVLVGMLLGVGWGLILAKCLPENEEWRKRKADRDENWEYRRRR